MADPASIRYKNPGAMWGSPRATKWGATSAVALRDGTGQGNTIADFPTFVQGAAAQFDLWRAVYSPMMLSAAIKKWSGGNSSDKYVNWLAKQVGITPSTRITRDFLSGAKGLQLMKAQAQWEAGRPYPMPDADWKRAQDMVFRGAVGPAKVNVQRHQSSHDEEVESAQNQLKMMGYYEVGTVDGLWGSKTAGALTAFLRDFGSTLMIRSTDNGIRPEVQSTLASALRKGFSRPVSIQRVTTTAQELAPKNAVVRQSLRQRVGAHVTGWASAVGAAIVGAAQAFPSVNDGIAPVRGFFDSVPGWVWFLLVAGGALVVYLSARNVTNSEVSAYQTGRIN